MKVRILFHGVAVVALVATVVAAAQTPSTPKKPAGAAPTQSADRQSSAPSISEREASSGMATGKRQYKPISITAGRESSAPSVSEREVGSGMATGRKSGSVMAADREAQSGMASGRRQHQPILTVAEESRTSAHATESLSVAEPAADSKGNMQGVSSNPMYKDNTMSGNNPLYESKDKQAAPNAGGSHDTVEYKDGEDMTTRTRPGNHKAGTVKPTSGATTPNQ
jgi:hypothetical protein